METPLLTIVRPSGPAPERLVRAAASVAASLKDVCPDARILGGTAGTGHERASVRVVFVQPTRTVVGLPGWRDALDGVLQTPDGPVEWWAFEVEKALRYALRQSYETLRLITGHDLRLASPELAPWWDRFLELAPSGVTREALGTLRAWTAYHANPVRSESDQRHAQVAARVAHRLAHSHVLAWPCPGSLFDASDIVVTPKAPDLSLPSRPPGYHDFDDYLADLRLALVAI